MEEGRLAQNKESVDLPGRVRKCLTEQAALRCNVEARVEMANAGGAKHSLAEGRTRGKVPCSRYQ